MGTPVTLHPETPLGAAEAQVSTTPRCSRGCSAPCGLPLSPGSGGCGPTCSTSGLPASSCLQSRRPTFPAPSPAPGAGVPVSLLVDRPQQPPQASWPPASLCRSTSSVTLG